jgi:ABC-type cobalamin/Fe3+-siderophores transport system ATPase subunit
MKPPAELHPATSEPIVLSGRGLQVAYDGTPVFDDLEIGVRRGQLVALIGPNGSGKSSLLRVLAGVQRPAHGVVTAANRVALIVPADAPPGDVTPTDLAGYACSVKRKWWQWSLPPQERSNVERALRRCRLDDRAHDPIGRLSAGEVQRAWIAAALACSADTILIDEPTTHLDLRFQMEVLRTLRELAGHGLTMMISVHDLTLAARFADVVALLAGGRLKLGTPEQILTEDLLARAFHVGVMTFPHPSDGYLICVPS